MEFSLQNVKIGGVEISTGSLALLLVFAVVVLVLGYWLVAEADDKTWRRVITIGTGIGGFLGGWIGRGATRQT